MGTPCSCELKSTRCSGVREPRGIVSFDSTVLRRGAHMRKSRKTAGVPDRARPLDHQKAHEIQAFNQLIRMPIALSESAARQSVTNLNQVLADTITLRDLYKKHHWQVAGPTFYQLPVVLLVKVDRKSTRLNSSHVRRSYAVFC